MYLCKTELFEIELCMCIKMDLALINLQRLLYHKTQTNKRMKNILCIYIYIYIYIYVCVCVCVCVWVRVCVCVCEYIFKL